MTSVPESDENRTRTRKESRLYAKLTLDFADSHKIAPLSDAAFRAYIRMVLWSRRMLTDGKIPGPMARFFAKPKALAELCSNDPVSPSLRKDGDDYWIHDFLEHQSSRAEVEAMQSRNAENGRRGGLAKAKRVASESLSENLAETYTESESQTETLLPPVDLSTHVLNREASPTIDKEKVRASVQKNCGRECDDMMVLRIVGTVMERAKVNPRNKTAFVVRAIENDPFVWQQFIDEAVAS